jgi:hypothetical protein
VLLLVGLAWSGLVGAPAQSGSVPSVCEPLVAEEVDPVAVRAALRASPESVRHICKMERSALGRAGFTTLFVLSGLAILPGVRDSARYARHTPLQLAVLRDSPPAARALVKAGADPTRTYEGASPLTLAVMHDVGVGGTTWTDLLLLHWDTPLPSDALSPEALDRLFFASELEALLRSKGLSGNGRAADGTTWLHRALIQDWSMPDSDDALIRRPIDRVEARNGELPRYEETIGPGARFYEEDVPRLSFAAVMARGARVDRKDAQGRTALYYAAYTGNWVAWDMLLAEGARPWKAGVRPESVLFALAAGGSPERFEQVLGRLMRREQVAVSDLSALAGSLVEPEPSGWCLKPEAMRPASTRCDEVPEQRATAELLAAVGAAPAPSWWTARVERQARSVLAQAVEVGFKPSMSPLKVAVRRKDWKTTRMLVPHAVLSPAEARRLRRMAARRGAPARVRRTIEQAQAQAERRR